MLRQEILSRDPINWDSDKTKFYEENEQIINEIKQRELAKTLLDQIDHKRIRQENQVRQKRIDDDILEKKLAKQRSEIFSTYRNETDEDFSLSRAQTPQPRQLTPPRIQVQPVYEDFKTTQKPKEYSTLQTTISESTIRPQQEPFRPMFTTNSNFSVVPNTQQSLFVSPIPMQTRVLDRMINDIKQETLVSGKQWSQVETELYALKKEVHLKRYDSMFTNPASTYIRYATPQPQRAIEFVPLVQAGRQLLQTPGHVTPPRRRIPSEVRKNTPTRKEAELKDLKARLEISKLDELISERLKADKSQHSLLTTQEHLEHRESYKRERASVSEADEAVVASVVSRHKLTLI